MIKLGKLTVPTKFRSKKGTLLTIGVLVVVGVGAWAVWHNDRLHNKAAILIKQTSTIPIVDDVTKDMFTQPKEEKDNKAINTKILSDFINKISSAPNQPIAAYANAIVIAQTLQPESVKMLSQKALANASDLGSKDKIVQAYIEFVRKAGA